MNELLIVFFIIRSVRTILYHLFWWDRKEYRFDRMLVHLRETVQGKQWLFSPLSIIKWTLLAFPLFGIRLSLLPVILVFSIEGIKSMIEFKDGWRTPPFRPRVTGIGIGAVITLVLIVFQMITTTISLAIAVLIVDKLIGPVIAFFVFVSNRVFHILKIRKIVLAREKINRAPHLKVIGVTGSYGKTTTKEFITQLLSSKYRVLKTIASQNSDIGVAELILRTDLSKYEYFVCEMAAYGRGEIASVCSMLTGQMIGGVITGINEQHQSLFKTLDCTMKSKFELIEAVNKGGFAFFNGANERCKTMFKWAEKRRLHARLVESDIISKRKLRVELPGEFFKQNSALAVVVGEACGMTSAEIKAGIQSVQVPHKTMNVVKKGSVTVIDDSFNANPDGVYRAIEYLGTFHQKKILVLQPLIELGSYADQIHQQIGRLAAQTCDAIILANPNWNDAVKRGAREIQGGLEKVMYMLPSWSHGNTVILYEGKESDKFRDECK